MPAVGEPLPFTGEEDQPKAGGGGGHARLRKRPPPSVGFAATFPREREKDPTAWIFDSRPHPLKAPDSVPLVKNRRIKG